MYDKKGPTHQISPPFQGGGVYFAEINGGGYCAFKKYRNAFKILTQHNRAQCRQVNG
jgi:hypothetical protein